MMMAMRRLLFKGGFDCPTGTFPSSGRRRIVVLGTGWGAHAFLKSVDAIKYEVVVVSPRNFFLFTVTRALALYAPLSHFVRACMHTDDSVHH
jgi:hypothetical protein